MNITFHVKIDGPATGLENMRRDAAMVDDVRGTESGIVRLYSWKPYAVSLGYNQDASAIDEEKCAARGIDVVRRPTGGRAVLHAEEITYAVATPLDGRSSQEWYAAIHRAIASGLSNIGMSDAAFVKSQPRFADVYKQSTGALCFSSSARFELEWNGKKFVGSAQRVIGDVLLQHGSILLGAFHQQLPELLNESAERRQIMSRFLSERSISIGEILNRTVTYEECCVALAEAMQGLLLEEVISQ